MLSDRTGWKASVLKMKELGRARRRHRASRDWIGHIDHVVDGVIVGWVKHSRSDVPLCVDVVLDGTVVATGLSASTYRADVKQAGLGDGRYGFSCVIPAGLAVEGARLELRLASSAQVVLQAVLAPSAARIEAIGAVPEVVPAAVEKVSPCEGRIEVLTDALLRGWATDTQMRGRLFSVDVLVDGVFLTRLRNDQRRGDLARHGKSDGLGGFQLNLFLAELEPGPHKVSVVLPDGQTLTATVDVAGNKRRYPLNTGVARIEPSDTTVIVPIYNAADDLAVCIERLVQYTPPEMKILLIDDASPDPRIAEILAEAGALPRFTVLRNPDNLGFTRTVNRGLAEAAGQHVILLNSDARVTPGWAQGMLRAAASRPRVATVTAMSDRAGAFSAPKIGNDNTLPEAVDEITYARAFRRRSLGLYPVVPTGNGFCMFINRQCIDEIGPLDSDAFPRGYGEENDFCMRAGRAGWNHLIDDRTYVFHARSKSFGDAKTDLMAAGRRVIDERYPEYKTAIATFTTGAELVMARFRATQALADCGRADAGKPAILYVVATQTGGTPQTNMDLMREISDEMVPWLLHCDASKMTLSRLVGDTMIEMRTHLLSEPVNPLSHRSGEYDAVAAEWLEMVDPRVVHIRHLAWHSLSLPALAKEAGSRIVFSFHDFYTLCPSVKLLDENNTFCGGRCTRSEGDCSIELWDQTQMPRIKDSWVHVWREPFAAVLKTCDAYVTTSVSARDRLVAQLNLDEERFHVIPHGRSFTRMEQLRQHPHHGEPVRILVPGNISAAKGRDVIKALLEHDRAGLFEFHLLGNVASDQELSQYSRLRLHGPYRRDGFAKRVADIKPQLGAVLSIWDETYCHTLTEMWSVGLPVIVFDFPTVAGRVNDSGAGWVVPHHDVASLYNRLVEISFDTAEQQRVDQAILRWQRGPGVGRSTQLMAAAYRQVYRQALGRPERRPSIAVVCPASPGLARANASTEIRIWERTVNGSDRDCVFVRMTADTVMANLGAGTLDGAIIQRDAIPATMVGPLLDEMDRSGLRYVFDLDDDLFNVPEDKDKTGRYEAYRTSLGALVRGAATVTTSTEPLRQKLLARNSNTILMPNRLSERLWRGALPPRDMDGVVRALYMGSFTHQADFEMIEPALAAVAEADPGFRVAVIGVQEGPLPPWAERIVVPEREKSYANFVPWLKDLSGSFDFALAPLTDDPFNLAKSCLKALECGALGLPVLASDMPVYRPLAGQLQGLRLVKSNELAWRKALAAEIAEVRAGPVDRAVIRASVMREHGLAGELEAFDQMLLDLKRPQETDVIVTLQRPQTPSVQKAVA